LRILITGAAGFIGSHLVEALWGDDNFICGLDNFLTGKHENYLAYECDIADRKSLYEWANGLRPELVIHCAASYKDPDKWHLDTDTNIAGAINVAAVAKHHGARVIYFQTVLPPISSYAISKIAAEHYLRLSGVPLTVFRLAAVYGPRNLSGAIPTFYRQVSQGLPCTVVEDATRDFVFIEDLVQRVLWEVEDRIPGVFDVRTGVETPIRHIPHLIGEMLDIEPIVNLVPRSHDDVAKYEMNGPPRVGTPFAEGLRKAVEWYEKNPVGETFTHLRIGEKNAS
jgi:UDP-glucose 4-epimerase